MRRRIVMFGRRSGPEHFLVARKKRTAQGDESPRE
jgi:hypothetical protein